LLGDFEVLTAQNGQKGCEMAVGERPDIIIMDLEMPGE
jgi:YesN/AraC family two-component response regulator